MTNHKSVTNNEVPRFAHLVRYVNERPDPVCGTDVRDQSLYARMTIRSKGQLIS